MQEIVCRYSKGEAVKYVSHLDLMRAWQRGLRRARIPVAAVKGASQRPKMAFGPALGVGTTSEAEHLVIELAEPLDPAVVQSALNANLPPGIEVLQCWSTPAHRRRFAVGDLDLSDYRITIAGPVEPEEIGKRVDAFMQSTMAPYHRQRGQHGRDLDVRPFVEEMRVEHADAGAAALRLRLKASGAGCASPHEVMSAIGYSRPEFRVEVHRLALFASGTTGKAARRQVGRLLRRPPRRTR